MPQILEEQRAGLGRLQDPQHPPFIGNNFSRASSRSRRSHVHNQTNTNTHHSDFISGQIRWWLCAENIQKHKCSHSNVFMIVKQLHTPRHSKMLPGLRTQHPSSPQRQPAPIITAVLPGDSAWFPTEETKAILDFKRVWRVYTWNYLQ